LAARDPAAQLAQQRAAFGRGVRASRMLMMVPIDRFCADGFVAVRGAVAADVTRAA
jgi:hypothetical protein